MRSLADLEARRQLLIAQAEFDRLKLALATHELRRSASFASASGEGRSGHSFAARVLGFAVPLLGLARIGLLVRGVPIALSLYRLVRRWRRRHASKH